MNISVTINGEGKIEKACAAADAMVMHGPAAEALLEGAEYGAETEDLAGSLNVAAAAGIRPPRRAAATTRMEEGAEETTEVAATAQQGAVTLVSQSDG